MATALAKAKGNFWFPESTRDGRGNRFAMDARTNIKGRPPTLHGTEGHAPHRAAVVAASDPTNAAPHLPATANESSIKSDVIGVAEIFKKTPCAAGLKPGGRYVAKDMQEVGGISLLMKTLLDNGHLHGDCITVTGRTITENLKGVRPMAVIDGVVDLKCNVAPEGTVVKVAGMSKLKFAGPASGFDREANASGAPNVKLTGAEPAERKTKWQPRATNHTSGALWKYAQRVGPAVDGAVTHPGGAHEKQYYADI
jgi:dihydroxyacid dehydratase/phosphogluconate dehydratase